MKLPERYEIEDKVYLPTSQRAFNYSDGDEIENYLFNVIKTASDISVGSEAFFSAIRDWPSNYHLSSQRVDLLRPLGEHLKGKRVLEVGCGCGAITRYLAELGCTVVALEGSYRRAAITAERCRDLDNVTVVADNFQDFTCDEKFDFVTLIGVLEYSNMFIEGDNPPLQLLEKAKSFMHAESHLIIAIENKLGLKYWAGAPEDHLGLPYVGVENKYAARTAITFGRKELNELLKSAGFPRLDYLYPFPDYKFPEVILTENGLKAEALEVDNLLVEKHDYFQGKAYCNAFSTTLAGQSLSGNHLLNEFANSFLIIASPSFTVKVISPDHLAFSYSTLRKKKFCKENLFVSDGEPSNCKVIRRYLYDDLSRESATLVNEIITEPYKQGHLLYGELVALVSQTDWSIQSLSGWAQRYHQIVASFSYRKGDESFLEGKYVDLSPFNILIQENGAFDVFDLEWIGKEEQPLYYILFRGIIYSLGRIVLFERPCATVPLNLVDLAIAVTNTVIHFTEGHLHQCKQREVALFSEVAIGQITTAFSFGNIQIRLKGDREESAAFIAENQRLMQELKLKDAALVQTHEKIGEVQQCVKKLEADQKSFKNEMTAGVFSTQEMVQKAGQQVEEVSRHLAAYQNDFSRFAGEMNLQLSQEREARQKQVEQMVYYQTELASMSELYRKGQDLILMQLQQMSARTNELEEEIKRSKSTYEEKLTALKEESCHLQQTLEWYRRTYEYRSFLGVIKEKLRFLSKPKTN